MLVVKPMSWSRGGHKKRLPALYSVCVFLVDLFGLFASLLFALFANYIEPCGVVSLVVVVVIVVVVVAAVVVVAVKYHELLAAKLTKNSDGTTEQTCKVLK